MPVTTARAALPEVSRAGHFVRFYDDGAYLLDEVAEFIGAALRGGGAGLIIAAPAHLASLEQRLSVGHSAGGQAQPHPGELVALDAQATLDRFLVEGWPDEERFMQSVGAVVAAAAAGGRQVHAFGEMVALLCADGRYDAAVRLEALWNELARRHAFSLFCAYPTRLFASTEQASAFQRVCDAHSHVCPSEHLGTDPNPVEAHRLVALWQQKANALEAEVARRQAAEAQRETLLSELEEACRAKDEFLAMLGHELRNPLSPIVTALQLMRMRGDTGTGREQGIIQRHVDHLVRLVDDLLDISKITRGKIELKKERIDVSEVLTKAVEMAGLLLEQRSHRLALDVQPGLRWEGDPVRLAQVVANLLTNAARYTHVGGDITLSARQADGDFLVIRVKDNGSGISPDILPRIFDLFFQGRRSVDRSEGGLGIGLALVRSLVEMHGGTVAAASEGPGRGSEFTIHLPLSKGTSANDERCPDGAVAQAAPAPLPRRVLVVDDNVDGADLLGHLLRAAGHQVQVLNDPVSALQAVDAFAPDVALLDIGLPVMDGYELAARLRERLGGRPCRFIALTGYGQDSDRGRSQHAGFEQHLVKPVDPERVVEVVGRPASVLDGATM